MDIQVSDILEMKKKHPCGADKMVVLRTGADLKLKCTGCGHEFMTPRAKTERRIKNILK
ncbi:MAG: DUF951 domain-containing protein [Oscillospiraceae bacterium]|nr:DUF951 domain-containing protein [Oscillospiraceae bacterium]